jgi:carboxypeptidase C (cathepsin A)
MGAARRQFMAGRVMIWCGLAGWRIAPQHRVMIRATLLITAAIAVFATQAIAADPPRPGPPPPQDQPDRLAMLPADAVTQHTITLGGRALAYTATAGTLKLRDVQGKPTAAVFTVAYTLNNPPPNRPVAFFFNGGPGAGSAYLQMGAAGPEILAFPDGAMADGARARRQPNPDSWLAFTDMVFIDPVGTGYSLAADPKAAPGAFWNVHADAESLAKAITLWLGHNQRTRSPKYVVGESYGGIRSVKVARALEEDQSVIVNGIVMVSPLLEEQYFFTDDPLTYAFWVPTLAAASLERQHKLTPQAADDAYAFATGPYVATLDGAPPEGDAARAFYHRVAGVTGVPEAIVAKQRGMLHPESHDVLSQDGKLFSLYEMSLSIDDPAPEGVDPDESPDPLLEGFGRAYGNAFAGYAADTLGYKTDLTYRLLDTAVNAEWDWREGPHHVLSTNSDLRKLLALNPSLHVLVAHGYFDAVCPFATSRWLIAHLPVGRDRVTLKVYPGGHMLYTRPAARAALARDVGQMVENAQAASGP